MDKFFSTTDQWIEQTTGAQNQAQLFSYQMERFSETVAYARVYSPFYRRLLGSIKPTAPPDELPFTTPADLAQHGRNMLCVNQSQIKKVVTLKTSGTTSPPKRIFFTQDDLNATIDFFAHGMQEFTLPGDRVCIMLPCDAQDSVGALLSDGLRQFGAVPIPYGVADSFTDLLRLFLNGKINIAVGLPQQLLELARLCRRESVFLPALRAVLTAADYSTPAATTEIEQSLDCTVYDNYGMTELCYGGGVFSKSRTGYHMRHNDFFFEIVHPVTGQPLPAGQYGEVVFTTLTRKGMPLIRYKTGDCSRILDGKYPVLEKIRGRMDELMDDAGLSIQLLDEILFSLEDVLDYTAHLCEDQLTLHVRSSRYDAEHIRNYIYSRLPQTLRGLRIHIREATERSIDTRTMRKHLIVREPTI